MDPPASRKIFGLHLRVSFLSVPHILHLLPNHLGCQDEIVGRPGNPTSAQSQHEDEVDTNPPALLGKFMNFFRAVDVIYQADKDKDRSLVDKCRAPSQPLPDTTVFDAEYTSNVACPFCSDETNHHLPLMQFVDKETVDAYNSAVEEEYEKSLTAYNRSRNRNGLQKPKKKKSQAYTVACMCSKQNCLNFGLKLL